MAFEIIEGKEYECEVDIWSIGVITFILLSGDAPFKGNNKS
jgi:serine/threonine protein kinase